MFIGGTTCTNTIVCNNKPTFPSEWKNRLIVIYCIDVDFSSVLYATLGIPRHCCCIKYMIQPAIKSNEAGKAGEKSKRR